MPVSGRLADMTAEGSSLRKPVSRRLSAHRRSLLGLSCSHRGIHLPCGRPARRASRRDSDGVSVFRVVEIRPGWVLPLRRDGGVRTAGTASPTVTCRFSTANPVLRSRIPSPEGADNGAYGNSLHVHPSGLPQYYSRGFPVCVRAAALRDAMLMAAGYMLSPPSGRRLSGGCLEEPGAVVVPAGGGLVASPPQRPAQGGREPGAGEQPGGGLPGQCGEPGGLGDR